MPDPIETLRRARHLVLLTGAGASAESGIPRFHGALDPATLQAAETAARQCDLCLSVGTSALVYPAAALPEIAVDAGATLVQVNPAPTPLDGVAHHNLHGTCGEILPALVNGAWPD